MFGTLPHRIDRFNGRFTFLSNFSPSPVLFDGMLFPTVEHGFQAAKTLDLQSRLALVQGTALSAGQAKRWGRSVQLRPDWERAKDAVMLDLLRCKFAGSPMLAQQLEDTGDTWLEEGNDWGDRYWGVVNGDGANRLGVLLMQVRGERRLAAARLAGRLGD